MHMHVHAWLHGATLLATYMCIVQEHKHTYIIRAHTWLHGHVDGSPCLRGPVRRSFSCSPGCPWPSMWHRRRRHGSSPVRPAQSGTRQAEDEASRLAGRWSASAWSLAEGEKRAQVQPALPKTKSGAIVLTSGSSSRHLFAGFTSACLFLFAYRRRCNWKRWKAAAPFFFPAAVGLWWRRTEGAPVRRLDLCSLRLPAPARFGGSS
jgi:hypothetical protein